MSDAVERLQLNIVSPERVVFSGAVDWVQVPLVDGLMGVWPGHAPLIAALGAGDLEISAGEDRRAVPLGGGLVHIDADGCTVLMGAAPSGSEGEGPNLEVLSRELEQALSDSLSEDEVRDLQRPKR